LLGRHEEPRTNEGKDGAALWGETHEEEHAMKYDIESMDGRVVALRMAGAAAEVCATLVREGFTVGETSGLVAPIFRGVATVGRLAFADNAAEASIDVVEDVEVLLADDQHQLDDAEVANDLAGVDDDEELIPDHVVSDGLFVP
jgi:hypothetical protein